MHQIMIYYQNKVSCSLKVQVSKLYFKIKLMRLSSQDVLGQNNGSYFNRNEF